MFLFKLFVSDSRMWMFWDQRLPVLRLMGHVAAPRCQSVQCRQCSRYLSTHPLIHGHFSRTEKKQDFLEGLILKEQDASHPWQRPFSHAPTFNRYLKQPQHQVRRCLVPAAGGGSMGARAKGCRRGRPRLRRLCAPLHLYLDSGDLLWTAP